MSDTTSEAAAEAPAAPVIRIETASATPEEAAVVVAVLMAAAGGDEEPPPARSHWAAPSVMMRPMVRPARDGWRFSGFAG